MSCWVCDKNDYDFVDHTKFNSIYETGKIDDTKINIDFVIPENSICNNCFYINFKKCDRCDTVTSISQNGVCNDCFPKFYPCIGCKKNDYKPISVKKSISIYSFYHKFLRKCDKCCVCKKCNAKIDIDDYSFVYEDEPCLFDIKFDVDKKMWIPDEICSNCKTDYDSDDSVNELTTENIAKQLSKVKRKKDPVPLKYNYETTLYRDSCDSDNEEKPKHKKVDDVNDLIDSIKTLNIQGEYTQDGLSQMKRDDLINIAKNKKLKNYSRLTKDKLIELILKN